MITSELTFYSLNDPPSEGLDGLIYRRIHGTIGEELLSDPTFEANVPEHYRRIAAASLESSYAGGYWIQGEQSRLPQWVQTAYLLASSRPANPCLALTFIERGKFDRHGRLLTLLLYNEFQQPIGLYIHESSSFLIYQHQPLDVAKLFFQREAGFELIDHLQDVALKHDLFALAHDGALQHALAFGFNKSFGHTHWNDVLGLLYCRSHKNIASLDSCISHSLVGPTQWIEPSRLTEHVTLSVNSVSACTDYLLKTSTCVHQPIGFSIESEYTEFWRYEVTAKIDPLLKHRLRQFRIDHWPIISLGLRHHEWWRKGWQQQADQVCTILNYIRQVYPSAGFVVDGLTAYHTKANLESTLHTALVETIQHCLGGGSCILDLGGAAIDAKAAAYQIVDYGISQFGSGDAIPHWVYALPSITISAEPFIIKAYSHPETITRLCRRGLENSWVCGHFLPYEYINLVEDGFKLNLEDSIPYILTHLGQVAVARS
jgi:hypothetical protein